MTTYKKLTWAQIVFASAAVVFAVSSRGHGFWLSAAALMVLLSVIVDLGRDR